VIGNNYFQALQVTIASSGNYTFTSVSSMNTYGYLYNGSFDPSHPSQNLTMSNDDGGFNRQFLLTVRLFCGMSYVLVVTTYDPMVTGNFSVTVSGPSSVDISVLKRSNSTTSEYSAQRSTAVVIDSV
jgi:hypothetical protein